MDTLLLVSLVVLDVLLFGYVYFSSRHKSGERSLLDEIREERKIIEELRVDLKDQMRKAEQKIYEMRDKIIAIASEAEIEHESVKSVFSENSSNIVSQVEAKLEEPIRKINDRCERAHSLLDRINKEREGLTKALKKAETLAKFFNKDLAYKDLLEEIEDHKYVDARQMLSRGVKPDVVATELNMPESEVRLILSLT